MRDVAGVCNPNMPLKTSALPAEVQMLTVDIDPKLYRDKAAECLTLVAEKRAQLRTASDPLVKQTLERSINTLKETLSTYEKIASNLEDIRRMERGVRPTY